MSLIENHYTMNLAYDGQHFARVEFSPSEPKQEIHRKAKQIAMAMSASFGTPKKWKFTLMRVECSGRYEWEQNGDERNTTGESGQG